MRLDDLAGQVFGRLLAVRHLEGEWWECHCLGKEQGVMHCQGRTFKTKRSRVMSGATRSCGCLAQDLRRERWAKELNKVVGVRFGHLVVLELVPPADRTSLGYSFTSAKMAVVKCQCDCGKQTTAMVRNLRSGATISCGCVRRTHGTTATRVRDVYIHYRHRSKHQIKKDFDISFEDFVLIVKQPCAYCKAISPERRCHGLDRVDNREGYTYGNVVPCCCICNLAKNGLPLSEFLAWRNSFAAKELTVEEVMSKTQDYVADGWRNLVADKDQLRKDLGMLKEQLED